MKRTRSVLITALGLLVVLGFTTLTASINVGFDLSQIGTEEFITKYILNTTTSLIVFFLVSWSRSISNRDSEEFAAREKTIRELAVKTGTDFGEYLAAMNLDKKKKAYLVIANEKIIKCREKLTKLKIKSPHKLRKIENLAAHLDTLNYKISEEYLAENLLWLRVKYNRINRNEIFSVESLATDDDTIINSRNYVVTRGISKVITSLVFSAILSGLVVNGLSASTGGWLILGTNVVNMLVNGITGLAFSDTLHQRIHVPNQLLRSRILKNYFKEVELNGK